MATFLFISKPNYVNHVCQVSASSFCHCLQNSAQSACWKYFQLIANIILTRKIIFSFWNSSIFLSGCHYDWILNNINRIGHLEPANQKKFLFVATISAFNVLRVYNNWIIFKHKNFFIFFCPQDSVNILKLSTSTDLYHRSRASYLRNITYWFFYTSEHPCRYWATGTTDVDCGIRVREQCWNF
jgi:hypothetical protein